MYLSAHKSRVIVSTTTTGLFFVLCCAMLLLSHTAMAANDPEVTIRFTNPRYDCETAVYALDVAVQSDVPNRELFGMNVRFFYDDAVMEFIGFDSFAGGYGVPGSSMPKVNVGAPHSGPALFDFDGPAAYVNSAVQLLNWSAPAVFIDTESWTTLFAVTFRVRDAATLDSEALCPCVLWDMEAVPEKGGFLPGGNGVVMTVVAEEFSRDSAPVNERVVQFNAAYAATTDGPFVHPVKEHCISLVCNDDAADDPADDELPEGESEGEDTEPGSGDNDDDDGDTTDPVETEGEDTGDDADDGTLGGDDEEDGVTDGADDDAPAEGEYGSDDEVAEREADSEEDVMNCGCTGCDGFNGKSLLERLGDLLLLSFSVLALLAITRSKKQF